MKNCLLYIIMGVTIILTSCTSVESKAESYATDMMEALLDDNLAKAQQIAEKANKWVETLSAADQVKAEMITEKVGEKYGPKLLEKFGEEKFYQLIRMLTGNTSSNSPSYYSSDYSSDDQSYYNSPNYEYGECDDVEEHLDETDYDENHVGNYYNGTSTTVGDDEYSVNFHDNPDGSISMEDDEGYSVSGYSDGNGVYVTDNEGRSEYIGF